MAVTHFSGRKDPFHPGAPNLARFVAVESYSHEVSICGFWQGDGHMDIPIFYSYAYRDPKEYKEFAIQSREAVYEFTLGEFVLP